MTYNKNQFEKILPFIREVPKWFILGGPADGNEAQCAVKRWPKVNVLGFEPFEPMFNYQLQNGWPQPENLFREALSDECGTAQLYLNPADNENSCRTASLDPLSKNREHPVSISTVTLDSLSQKFPIQDALLWIDIEGSELKALRGATRLFNREKIRWVNVEMMFRRNDLNEAVHTFLTVYGFNAFKVWNNQPKFVCDRFYYKKRDESTYCDNCPLHPCS